MMGIGKVLGTFDLQFSVASEKEKVGYIALNETFSQKEDTWLTEGVNQVAISDNIQEYNFSVVSIPNLQATRVIDLHLKPGGVPPQVDLSFYEGAEPTVDTADATYANFFLPSSMVADLFGGMRIPSGILVRRRGFFCTLQFSQRYPATSRYFRPGNLPRIERENSLCGLCPRHRPRGSPRRVLHSNRVGAAHHNDFSHSARRNSSFGHTACHRCVAGGHIGIRSMVYAKSQSLRAFEQSDCLLLVTWTVMSAVAFDAGCGRYRESPVVSVQSFPSATTSSAIAELERNLIIERVRAGMRRAQLEGRQIGRAPLQVDRVALLRDRRIGKTLGDLAIAYQISKASVCRVEHWHLSHHCGLQRTKPRV